MWICIYSLHIGAMHASTRSIITNIAISTNLMPRRPVSERLRNEPTDRRDSTQFMNRSGQTLDLVSAKGMTVKTAWSGREKGPA